MGTGFAAMSAWAHATEPYALEEKEMTWKEFKEAVEDEKMDTDTWLFKGMLEMLFGLLAGFVIGTILPYLWWTAGLMAFVVIFGICRVSMNLKR